jgi:hypothetical protein
MNYLLLPIFLWVLFCNHICFYEIAVVKSFLSTLLCPTTYIYRFELLKNVPSLCLRLLVFFNPFLFHQHIFLKQVKIFFFLLFKYLFWIFMRRKFVSLWHTSVWLCAVPSYQLVLFESLPYRGRK